MTCPSPEQLAARVDGELSENDAQAIDLHVGQCARCRAALDHVLAIRRGLARLPPPEDASFAAEVLARSMVRDARARRSTAPALWLGGLAAAAVAVVVAVVVTRPASPGSDPSEYTARGGGHGLVVVPSLDGPADGARVVLRPGEPRATAPGFGLGLRVIDGATPSWLVVFGVDARCEVHWLVPSWDDAANDPSGLQLAGDGSVRDLPQGLRPDAPPGRFILTALATSRPLSVKTAEAALAACQSRGPEAAIAELARAHDGTATRFPIDIRAGVPR